jgi:hypothetical protein
MKDGEKGRQPSLLLLVVDPVAAAGVYQTQGLKKRIRARD